MSKQIVCLGEALVDLICPDPVDSPAEARCFEAHPGGALANVAVAVARAGAPAALAGGIGGDPFGELLWGRLRAEGVDTSRVKRLDGLETPFAFVTVDRRREPTFRIHGAGIEAGVGAWSGEEERLIANCSALVVGSNTLVDPRSAEVTERAVAHAVGAGVPLAFDVNLRAPRWEDLERARRVCLKLASECTLLKCNRAEAGWLLGLKSAEDETLVEGLARAGAHRCFGVLTRGGAGALMAGAAKATASAPAVEAPFPLGSGDAFMGTLCAGLLGRDWEPAGAAVVLERAAIAGAEAARSHSALGDPGCGARA